MEAAAITSEACQTSQSDEALTRQIAFPYSATRTISLPGLRSE
jgi:hypothetical protein